MRQRRNRLGARRGWLLAAAACIGAATSTAANAALVGPAADYGVFIFGSGNFSSQNTDSARSIAVGGNATLQNYSVASEISGNPSATPNPARLVVGGNLTAQNGGVGQAQNGALYVGGATSLTGFTATGGQFAQSLVDFGAAATLYTSLSGSYGAMTATGSTTLDASNTLTLAGSGGALNVFTVTAAQLSASNTIDILTPSGSTILINVTGNNAVFQNGQVFFNGAVATANAALVLYNFATATSVTLAGSKNPMGSILAPYAGVTGGYGALNGQLITGSYGGSGGDPFGHTEFHGTAFAGNIPTVPLPAAGWLLVSGLAALGLFRRAPARAG